MLKRLRAPVSIAVAALFTLAGCEGPVGPAGPAGPAGPEGPPGTSNVETVLHASLDGNQPVPDGTTTAVVVVSGFSQRTCAPASRQARTIDPEANHLLRDPPAGRAIVRAGSRAPSSRDRSAGAIVL